MIWVLIFIVPGVLQNMGGWSAPVIQNIGARSAPEVKKRVTGVLLELIFYSAWSAPGTSGTGEISDLSILE